MTSTTPGKIWATTACRSPLTTLEHDRMHSTKMQKDARTCRHESIFVELPIEFGHCCSHVAKSVTIQYDEQAIRDWFIRFGDSMGEVLIGNYAWMVCNQSFFCSNEGPWADRKRRVIHFSHAVHQPEPGAAWLVLRSTPRCKCIYDDRLASSSIPLASFSGNISEN